MTSDPETVSYVVVLGITVLVVGAGAGALFWQNRYYDRKWREPSSETWTKAREKKARGEFHRKVKRQVAVSLERDELELECGHHYPVVDKPPKDSYECKQCLEAWVKAETKAGR